MPLVVLTRRRGGGRALPPAQTSENNRTCAGRVGSFGYELQDAATYCDWGVDFVKIDHCGSGAPGIDGPAHMNQSWVAFREGFDACAARGGRSMVMSVEYCTAPVALKQCVGWFASSDPTHDDLRPCEQWVREAGANMWRVASDIKPHPETLLHNAFCGSNLQQLAGHWGGVSHGGANGSGHWNDLDLLQVGNGGMSVGWEQLHFSLWSILAAPLLISTDILSISNASLEVLLNAAVISVNQDALGVQGKALRQTEPGQPVFTDGWAAFAKPLSGGDVALLVINSNAAALNASLGFTELGLPAGTASVGVRNLWTNATLLAIADGKLPIELGGAKGGAAMFVMLRLVPGK